MTRRRLFALAGLGLAALVATPALSCTTVCLGDGARPVVAYNYDLDPHEGLVLVNKRNVTKRSFLGGQGASWTAAYGSVTFNQFGRDNPTTGINEKGLMVSLMWLDETKYPTADGRPAVGVLEWIQYNLDRHASVAEVLANAEAVRPMSRVPIHYLFADAAGDVVVVEFLDELVSHRGQSLPVRVLANSTYDDSLAALRAATGRTELPASASSLDRFVRAAVLARGATADPIARGFKILAAVAQPGFTRWSIVRSRGAGTPFPHRRQRGDPPRCPVRARLLLHHARQDARRHRRRDRGRHPRLRRLHAGRQSSPHRGQLHEDAIPPGVPGRGQGHRGRAPRDHLIVRGAEVRRRVLLIDCNAAVPHSFAGAGQRLESRNGRFAVYECRPSGPMRDAPTLGSETTLTAQALDIPQLAETSPKGPKSLQSPPDRPHKEGHALIAGKESRPTTHRPRSGQARARWMTNRR